MDLGNQTFKDRIEPGPALDSRWKQILDYGLIIVILPLLAPLMISIGVLIRVVSKGPALFKQERIGQRGDRFLCYKFRTMRMNSHSAAHQDHLAQLMASDKPMEKMDSKGDPRIIPFGRLLRSAGFDELPQIFNVLKREMSLVGPRPCLSYEFEKYLPWQRERFNALPGLTGLWQVSGKNHTTFAEMIELDIRYARNRSLLLDLKIILMTVPTLLFQILEMIISDKSAKGEVVSKTIISKNSVDECCLHKAALITVISAATDTEHIKRLGV